MNIAKSLAYYMKIEPIPLTKCFVFRKNKLMRMIIVDMAIASLKDKFEQLKIFANIFGFLFDSND